MGQDGAVGGDTKTILVIGDASRIAATLVDNLEDAAYRVVFSPPEAALRLAVNHHPLLVLTDLSHEGGASAAAVRALKRDPELADSLVVQMVDERDAAGDLPTLPLGVASLMGGYLFLQFGPDGLLAQIRALLQTRASMIAAHQRQIEETHSAGMARQQTFLDALADLAFAKDAAFRYVMVNKANCSFFGRSQEDILGKTDFDLMPEAQARACRLTDEQALGEGRVVVSTEAVGDRLFETRKFPVPLHSGMGVGGVIRDVTAERSGQDVLQQSEARLRSLVSVLQYPAKTVQELLDSALNEGIALTESKIGYIYHYDEARSQFILNTWSRDVMPACSVVDPETVYDLDATGIWGEVVRQRKPIVVNDFGAPHPLKRGLPEGHVDLESFLSVPVMRDDRIVAVVGVANKPTAYAEADVLQLTLLMDGVWNVVERLKAEAAARRERDNLTSVLEAAPVAMLVFDDSEALLFANTEAEALFGQRDQTWVGRRCGDFFACVNRHQDPRGCGNSEACADCSLAHAIRATLKGEAGRAGETLLARDAPAEPSWVTYGVNAVVLDGRQCAVMALSDVTPRKRAQDALLQERRLLRTVIDNLPDSVYAKDHLGRKTLANPVDLNYIGADSEAEVLGKTDMELFPSEVAMALVADDEQVMVTGTPVRDREEIVVDRSGHTRRLLTSKFPLRDASGQVVGLVGTGRDVTEHRRAESERRLLLAQVQAQAAQLQQVMETVPQGVLLLDDHGHVLLANVAAKSNLAVLGHGIGDRITALGDHSLSELLAPPPKGLRHEVQVEDRIFEAIAQPIEREARSQQGHWVMVLNDVTEGYRVRDQLQQQARLAAVGQLAAGIAHDFNNIMAVIILYARMTEAAPGLSARDRERLVAINQQAYHATKLIEQLLDFSRSSVLDKRPLDLLPLVAEHAKLLERTLPESITVSSTSGQDDYTIEGDVTRLQQMLLNLAINARDAMPQGGELRFTLTRISVAPDVPPPLVGMRVGAWVKLTVSDTGTGIPDGVLSHLFEPFHTTKAPGQGTGLGLAQVHGIVMQHEGYIDVETAEGVGTTFSVYLPAPAVLRTVEAPLAEEELMHGAGEVVLIVEDNAALREALHDTLVGWRYQVREAADGRQALALLEAESCDIDAVLSDVVMPTMGGPALALAMHTRGHVLPIILMSGHAETHAFSELSDCGVRGWLRKPLQLDELARMLGTLFARHAPS